MTENAESECFHDRVADAMQRHNLTERQALDLIHDMDVFEAKRAAKIQIDSSGSEQS